MIAHRASPGGPAKRRLHVVTMVDGIGSYGGGESLARQIAQRLDRERFRSTLCVTRWEPLPEFDQARKELADSDTGFIGMRRGSRFDLRPWRRLIEDLRRLEVDILHTHKIGSNLWGALVAPLAPVPVFVAHEHTWSFQGNLPRKLVDRELIARRADAFVAVSREDRRRMAEIEGIPEEKLRFIQNGIPEMRPPDPKADPRRELGIAINAPVVGAVATLRPQKALDVLLRAFQIVQREFPEARLVIVGGSPGEGEEGEEVRLKQLTEELGLQDSVVFAGLRTDVPDLLAAFDVAALSSDFEGSPLSILEYMQAGKAIVSTRVGGIGDLIEDGRTGLLVEPRDVEGLARSIATLLRDRDLAARLAAEAKKTQVERFTIDATTREIEDLYTELWGERLRT